MMDERKDRDSGGRRLKLFAGLVATAFAVTLALVIGNRLSDEALGVLAGAVCGVGAAIPTSLIVVAVTRRRGETNGKELQHPPLQQSSYPPVIVVSPQSGRQWPDSQWNALPSSLAAPMERNFTVVGGVSAGMEATRYGDERR